MSPNGKPKQPPQRCRSTVAHESDPKVIDQNGDTFPWRGHVLKIPPGALSGPVTFQMFEPAAPILKLVIRADGSDHLAFMKAVQLTINYARCFGPGGPTLPPKVQIVRLDAKDDTQEELGGNDERPHKRVTTDLDHLSGYSIAGG